MGRQYGYAVVGMMLAISLAVLSGCSLSKTGPDPDSLPALVDKAPTSKL